MPTIGSNYKYAHRHAKLRQRITDPLLFLGGTSHHAIILNGPETLIMGPFDLVYKILPRMVAEHTIVETIKHFERLTGYRAGIGIS
jgi:hypothetical protein